MVKSLRSGVTTGASAAAAAQAAVIRLFKGEEIRAARIVNSRGQEIIVPIKHVSVHQGYVEAVVVKDGGDDPDVTDGLDISVSVSVSAKDIVLIGGTGVGIVTKPGLQVPVGDSAINPVPRQMIIDAVREFIPGGTGVKITVSVPGGEEVAKKTLNPKLGIVGGISILGTTGIVEPMSEEAFKRSLVSQVSMARCYGFSTVCLTPGRLGERWSSEKIGIPAEAVVQISNFVGYMLKECVAQGVKKVILTGHHSKLTKVAAGNFHTHNKVSDARLETLAAYAGLLGASPLVIGEILNCITSEGALEILREHGLMEVMPLIAAKAAQRAMNHVFDEIQVGVVMFTMAGDILAVDDNAVQIGREMNWRIKSGLSG